MTTAQILESARIIVRDNWTVGELCDTHGRYCALGAIGSAMGITDDELIQANSDDIYNLIAHSEAGQIIAEVIRKETGRYDGENVDLIIDYNDFIQSKEHQKKVIAIFDEALQQV